MTIEKWQTTRVSVSLNVLATAVVVAAALLAAALLFTRSHKPVSQEIAQDQLQDPTDRSVEDELLETARDWTDNSIDGAAGDELVRFIVERSNTGQPEELGSFVKEGLRLATTWTYGPTVQLRGDRYEVTATASTRVHEIVPIQYIFLSQGAQESDAPDGLDDPRKIVHMPFHLTINLGSKEVSDWHVHADEAIYDINVPLAMSLEEAYGKTAADCIHAVLEVELPDSTEIALFREPNEREWIEARQLNEAIIKAGLGDVCKTWIAHPVEQEG